MKTGCTIRWATGKAEQGVLTDEHAQSSYGLPVLVIDGEAYGPGDVRL